MLLFDATDSEMLATAVNKKQINKQQTEAMRRNNASIVEHPTVPVPNLIKMVSSVQNFCQIERQTNIGRASGYPK
jgi:hypothetical protein